MKETIDNIRYLNDDKNYVGPPAITCDIDGVTQTPWLLSLAETMNLREASAEEREKTLRRIAERRFSPQNRLRATVEVSDVKLLTHRWHPTIGNVGLMCKLDGVQYQPKPIDATMYTAWKKIPDDLKPQFERSMVEYAFRHEMDELLKNRENRIVHLKGDIYREQLDALLDKVNIHEGQQLLKQLDDPNLPGRSVVKGPHGTETVHYKDLVLLVRGTLGSEIVTDPEAIYEYKNTSLAKLLAEKLVTDADVSEVLADGKAYVSCRINGVAQPPKAVREALYAKYESGIYEAADVARESFYKEMLDTQKHQRIEVDMGCRIMDGKNVTYQAGQGEYGTYYKDSKAFERKEGVCYISEAAYEEYEDQLKTGAKVNVEDYVWNYNDFLAEARDHSFREPEKQAQLAFANVDGCGVSTELEQIAASCEESEFMTTAEDMRARYKWFVEEHGKMPNYAQVDILWNEEEQPQEYTIALNAKAGEFADDEVVFTCESPEDFFRLEREDNGEDFRVVGLIRYNSGMLEYEENRAIEKHEEQAEAIGHNAIVTVERENNWQSDIYVVFKRADGTADGCYVKPDGTVYDSPTGLNGKKLEDIIGIKDADTVMHMGQFNVLDRRTSTMSPLNRVTDMVIMKKGDFPYEKGMLRCKINGEQQSWHDISLRDYRSVIAAVSKEQRESIKLDLVNKYFADELRSSNSQEQRHNTGMRR